jgi:cellulose synthase/poly-beta-1,6-N-acetylglucosamine synthase-like glycosyltransferase
MLNNLLEFIASRSASELLSLFWYFFLFELTRYVILDGIVIMAFLSKRLVQTRQFTTARGMLFGERPLISVISPGRNEGKHIQRLVASLQEQTYTNFELIIVDDGSDDNTYDICKRLYKQGHITRFFRNTHRGGKASAANLALRYAKGRFIVHLDADSHLKSDALERIIAPFYIDGRIGAVGGDIRVANLDASLCASLQCIEYMKALSTGRTVASTLGILRIVSGAYGAFRADLLHRLKGWDPGPGLDGDITLKIRKMGYKVVHAPDSACYTNVPTTFGKLTKQRYRWERSLIRFRFRKHKDLFSLRNKNFNIFNTLTVVDNILYNFVFNIKWWIYIGQILFFNQDVLHYVVTINIILYTMSNSIEFLMACLLYGPTLRESELQRAIYLPLMPFYTGWYLRVIRTYSHIMELFFHASYRDKWNPWKVSSVARKSKM